MGTKTSSGSQFLCPAGTYVSRCVRCIDVGTHTNNFGNRAHKVILSWEMPSALIEEGDHAGEPFMLSRLYTLSLHKKSNLRPDLEAWRAKKFSGEEIRDGFETAEMVGVPCLLTVTHSTPDDEGRVFANPTGVAALMADMECGAQVNESLVYDIGAPDEKVYDKLPEWQQKMIDGSEEAVGGAVQSAKAEQPPPPTDDDVF